MLDQNLKSVRNGTERTHGQLIGLGIRKFWCWDRFSFESLGHRVSHGYVA